MIEIPEKKISGNALNGLSLAFIGDAVYEIMVREHLLEHGSLQVKKLHTMAVEMVRASFQADVPKRKTEFFTEEETQLPPTFPKAQTPLNTARQRVLKLFSAGFILNRKTKESANFLK